MSIPIRKRRNTLYLLEGFKIALDHIDEVIAIIRGSATAEEAKRLMDRFSLSHPQAQAILDMRLRRLTGLEREEILNELEAVRAEIARLKSILNDEGLLMDLIEAEMLAVKEQFGDERRTQVVQSEADFDLEDLIPVEDMVVTISNSGYIKRVPVNEYELSVVVVAAEWDE